MPTRSKAPERPETYASGDKVKMLLHAPGGHGKTHFLGTAALDERTAPMLFLNFDAGDATLRGLKEISKGGIEIRDVRDLKDYEAAYEELTDDGAPWRSVGLDSVSETQVGGLFAILEAGGLSKSGRAHPDILEQSDWGIILVQMRRLIRHFKWLDMHVFMTALSKSDSLPRIGSVLRPSLQGQFADDILGIPDIVAYLALDETEADDPDAEPPRVLLLRNAPKFMVKCRTPWGVTVPSEIEDPTVTKLLDVLGY